MLFAAAAVFAAGAAQAAPPTVGHVFVIAMENHNWTQPLGITGPSQIFGNAAAPYINSLVTAGNPNAAQVSFASNYTNGPGVHPSEPNYVWAEAGVHGPLNDAQPYPSNIVNAQNLSNLLQTHGETWRSYQEDTDLATNASGKLTNTVLPTNQYTVPLTNNSGTSADYTNPYNGSHQYNYAAKHNPQVFFTATNGGNDSSPSNPLAQDYAPMQQLSTDLTNNTVADYSWITPDQFNDMHTALNGGFTYHGVTYTGDEASIAQGDNFLSQVVPMIMASQAYQDNGAILIWNDETEGETPATANLFTSMEILISPLARGNAYTNTIAYNHSSDLRTMQEIFGVGPQQGIDFLGGAKSATDLSDLFRPGSIASVPEPGTWSLMLAGFLGAGVMMRRARRTTARA
jgi:hypothetical protein